MDIERNIRLKRVYDPPADGDGIRILATRYWPRGVHRSTVHEYDSQLAPSRELIKEYQRGEIKWTEFERRYRRELENDASQAKLKRLATLARSNVITLLCFCVDEKDCHRTLLREAIVRVSAN